MSRSSFILRLSEVDKEDISVAGTKGSYLGELTKLGLPIPEGFVITSFAYFQFLQENDLIEKIKGLLSTASYQHSESLMQVSDHIKRLITTSPMPSAIKDIDNAYRRLGGIFNAAEVAVRPSITSSDLASAAFTGHLQTSLDVQGEANLLIKIKEAWASLFDAGALSYRNEHKIDHFRVGVGIVVQKMITAEKSGIILTTDPVTNDKSKMVIEAILGENTLLTNEEVTPDHYEVDKNDLRIIKKHISHQPKMVKKTKGVISEMNLSTANGGQQKISQNHIVDLALLGKKIEQQYYFPQEIAWVICKNKIFIIDIKPMHTSETNPLHQDHRTTSHLPLLLRGTPGANGMTSGPVTVVTEAKNLGIVSHGDVLVLSQADTAFLPFMKKASAIITDKGGRTSYAAHTARSLGIPAVVGAENATKLSHGTVVTVNGSKGEVYKSAHHTYTSGHTVTQIFTTITNTSDALTAAKEDVKGIGLLQGEHLSIEEGSDYVVNLAHELETICRAFFPRPVIYQAYGHIYNPTLLINQFKAIKHVTNTMKLHNLSLMLPSVHTTKELMQIKHLMLDAGLHRSATLKLWVMIETPANALMVDKFITEGIDGISIDTHSLTKLMLGIDPEDSRTASSFDESHPAVLAVIEQAIKAAHKHHIHSSITGTAPVFYPLFLEKLVHWGITSVSVPLNDIHTIRKNLTMFERNMVENRYQEQ